jgi:multidrug transporter EmrE-like cation transporter
MSPAKIVGIILIVLGVGALAYGGFSYTKETHKAEIGPLKLSVKEKEQVNVPQWAGIGAIVAGVVLLVVGGGKK